MTRYRTCRRDWCLPPTAAALVSSLWWLGDAIHSGCTRALTALHLLDK